MGGQLPLWLGPVLSASLREVGATAPENDLDAEASYILSSWDQDHRILFNTRYLALAFERLDEIEGATPDPSALRLAVAYYGASYDPVNAFLGPKFRKQTGPGSIDVSAHLQDLGVPEEESARITELVEFLADPKLPTEDLEAQILLDSNLAVLAVSPQAYAKICRNLRNNSTLDDEQFLRARREHIRTMLSRSRLFLTPFAAHWANAVRENLTGELSQIDSRLETLNDDIPDDEPTPEEKLASKSSTGPIVIRSSRIQKQSALADAETAHREDEAPTRVPMAARKVKEVEEPVEKASPTRDLDETSTLESFDDPFSHRKRRG